MYFWLRLDVAHGGSGLYEKLVVLGTRALETFSEVYVYEQFDPTGIPPDLLGGTQIPEEVSLKNVHLKHHKALQNCVS